MSQETQADERDALIECWCCGGGYPPRRVVHLGRHPEVGVCLGCARFLHLRAAERRDSLRPTPASRLRDVLRSGRNVVIHRGWHRVPLIGPFLRWLGRHLP